MLEYGFIFKGRFDNVRFHILAMFIICKRFILIAV